MLNAETDLAIAIVAAILFLSFGKSLGKKKIIADSATRAAGKQWRGDCPKNSQISQTNSLLLIYSTMIFFVMA
ncbi:hypothetical protein [Chryseobacterium sp. SC28]|uniref:hypothetical protein n=1 Tax=Chryseobacterium sp. SC28 TaxID=2268028 RepID=UPI000F64EC23|nr:hypothetical protein [Chryseobacterium sp. SC28]